MSNLLTPSRTGCSLLLGWSEDNNSSLEIDCSIETGMHDQLSLKKSGIILIEQEKSTQGPRSAKETGCYQGESR